MTVSGRALNRAIGDRVRAARLARGLSLADLSALTGDSLSVSSISHYELGQRRLSIEAARTLARALGGMSAAYLLCLEEDGAPAKVDADEARLLAAFRAMDAEGRRQVLTVAVSAAACGASWSGSRCQDGGAELDSSERAAGLTGQGKRSEKGAGGAR
jgi:transcriptional regulator with XRE-family HTH domain